MKKGLKILLMAITLGSFAFAVSCSKENTEWQEMSDTSIELGIANIAALDTKVTDDGFESTDNITVYGYLVKDNNKLDNEENAVQYNSPYVHNLTFQYSECKEDKDSDGVEDYISNYYWPKFEYCDYESIWFYAYYGVNTGSGENTTGPTFIPPKDNATPPYFKYTSDVANKCATEDFLIAQQNAKENNVDLKFKRPLAKVVWKVKNADWIGAKGIDIFLKVYNSATFNYKLKSGYTTFNTYEDEGTGWSEKAGESLITIHNDGQYNGDATANTEAIVVGTCYIIPKDITEFAIVYNYHKEKVDLSSAPIKLTPGTQYTITIVISKDKVIRIETSDGKKEWYTIINENTIS